MMARAVYFILFLTLFPFTGTFAQNLVLNGDFETYSACPTDTAQIDYSPTYTSFPTVKAWVIPTGGTADYFDTCAASIVDVPQNHYGYQPAHSGAGYIGLHAYTDSSYSRGEYVQTRLTTTMTAGHKYYMVFYVNYAMWNANLNFVAIDSMGLALSDTMVNNFSAPYLSLTPCLASPAGNYITDSSAWLKVEGFYTATGTEQWAILGKFISHTPVSHVFMYNAGPSFSQASYMYIDDVCITDFSNPTALATTDTIVCMSSFPITLHSTELSTDYVQWDNGDTTHDRVVLDTGTYWFTKVSNCIAYTDTIKVHPKTIMDYVFHTADTTICAESFPLSLHCVISDSIIWNTGDTTSVITATDTGTYIAGSFIDCTYYIDTFRVAQFPVPLPVITQNDTFLSTGAYVTYQWQLNGNPIPGANAQTYIATLPGLYTVLVTDANGCKGLSTTVTVTILGVENIMSGTAISLSPNPVHDILYLQSAISHSATLTISDLTGRVLISQPLTGYDKIDLRMLAKGVYLYQVSNAGLIKAHGKLLKD